MVNFKTWLVKNSLGKYYHKLAAQEIKNVESLTFLTKDEIVDLASKVGMNVKSRRKFFAALERLSSKDQSDQVHDFNSIIMAVDEEKLQLENLIEKAKRKNTEADEGLLYTKINLSELDNSASLVMTEIHEFCEKHRQAWNDREGKLLDELSRIVKLKKKKMSQRVEILSKESRNIGKTVRDAEKALFDQNGIQTLLVSGELRNRLNHIVKKKFDSKISNDICFIPEPLSVLPIASAGQLHKSMASATGRTLKSITSPEHTTAGGAGLAHTRPGDSAFFTIVAKDKHGRQRDCGGDKFKVQIAGCKTKMKTKIKDMKNGIYTVEYILPKSVTKTSVHMSVRVNKKHIRGSPFTLSVSQECRGTFVHMWGSNGDEKGEFSSPTDVLVHNDCVYVTDYGNERIQVFGLDGTFIRMWGMPGEGPGQFSRPEGVAVDGNNVYVTDYGNHRIQVFQQDGTFVRMWGTHGTEPGQFNSPIGIAVRNNYVYVTEYGNHRIQVFRLDGTFVRTWGSKGNNMGQFNLPYYVAVDSENVYVTDKGNNRIQVFQLDGTFVRMWGSYGDKKGEFSNPTGLVVDGKYVYVTEYSNHRVQVFRVNGTFVRMWGSRGSDKCQLSNPWGIGVSGGIVYVAESSCNRIQVFR